MKPLSIFARAVPWGIPNTYREVLMAGCLKTSLPSKLPMFIMHNDKVPECGTWQRFTDTPEGLFVQGLITDQEAISRVMAGEFAELSITFRQLGTADSFFEVLKGTREYRSLVSKETLQSRGHKKFPGKQTFWENMPAYVVWEAELSEISLVDHGSFPGTQFHIVGETQEQLKRRLERKTKQ